MASLTLPTAWSIFPRFFSFLSLVSTPTASSTRPLTLSVVPFIRHFSRELRIRCSIKLLTWRRDCHWHQQRAVRQAAIDCTDASPIFSLPVLEHHPHRPPNQNEDNQRSHQSGESAAQAEDLLVVTGNGAVKGVRLDNSPSDGRESVCNKAGEGRVREAGGQSREQAQFFGPGR